MGYYGSRPLLFQMQGSNVPDMDNGVLISTTGSSSRKVPSGVTSIDIEIWGGGASGAAFNLPIPKYSGGAGAYCKRDNKTVTPGDVFSFSIGAGGSARSANSNGVDGGDTTCDGMTGGGGQDGNATNGLGGTASGGDINTNGGDGADQGDGGDSPNGGTGSGDSTPGNAPGGGGGWSSTTSGAGANGGIKFSW